MARLLCRRTHTLRTGAACFVVGEAGFASGYAAADRALYRVKEQGRDGWLASEGADTVEESGKV